MSLHSVNFLHNSWDSVYRTPFGAQPIGGTVTIRVYSKDANNVRLRTYYMDQETIITMVNAKEPYYWETTLELPNTPEILWYSFSLDALGKTYTYGTQSDNLGGEGQIYEDLPPSFQITLYDPKRMIPSWYTQGIMYQIFPDRFKRGDDFSIDHFPSNAIVHPHWDDSPHYFRDAEGNIEYWDFFGGTLDGITQKLDYLKSLNVSILYLNPIFESHSNHRYDTGNYMHIDPILGNQESFEALIKASKERGIAIILDGVFSHTGDDSLYFNRYHYYPELGAFESPDSPYYSWYDFIDYPNQYTCWWGVKSMPNTNELEADFQNYIYKNKDSVIKHWMNLGVSGWRLDVADELPDEFIKGLKEGMLEENDQSILIGEVWEDASRKIAYGKIRSYFSGYELDAVMNYPFRETFIDFVLGQKSSRYSLRIMMSLYEHYPKNQFMGNMNLIGSHDRRRILTVLGEAHEYCKDSEREHYQLSLEQYNLARKRLKLLSLIQMTFPGVPCIYYGDEAGVQGFEDPYNRRTYPWGNEDQELLDWYRLITKIRTNSKALQNGSWHPQEAGDDLLIYERTYGEETCLCLFNRNTKAIHLYENPQYMHRKGIDLITNTELSLDTIVIEPLSFAVVQVKNKQSQHFISTSVYSK